MTDQQIFPDMPDALYFDGSHFGIHSISDFTTYGPRGFWDRHIDRNHTDYGSRSYDIGTATHEAVLRGETAMLARVARLPESYIGRRYLGKRESKKIKKDVTVMELMGYKWDDKLERLYLNETRPWNGNAEECKQWIREHKGKIILNDSDYHTVYECLESVHETEEVMEYMQYGDPEVGLRTHIGSLPVQCKCDWLASDKNGAYRAIVDLKTCITLDDFLRSFHKYKYWRQAAHYTRVARSVLGVTIPFIFVAVEKQNPNRCEMFQIDDEYLAEADQVNVKDYEAISYYMEQFGPRKPWPRQHEPKGVQTINKPAWLGEN